MKYTKGILVFSALVALLADTFSVNAETVWSDWVYSVPEEIGDDYDIEERTVYRYRDKQITNSSKSSLEGWTQYDSKVTYGSWGNWSAYSPTTQTKSDTKDVRTETYYRYYWYYCPVCGAYEPLTGWSDCGKYQLTSADFHTMWIAWQYAPTDSHSFSYAPKIKYTDILVPEHRVCFAAGNIYDTTPGTKDANGSGATVIATWYSYRTRTKTTTYYYYKWSEWSEWSDKQPEEIDDREIESIKQYRYRAASVLMDNVTTIEGPQEPTTQEVASSETTTQESVPQTPQPTTEQVTTEATRQTANAGTVTLVTMDEQEETGAEATSGGNDSKVKIKKNPGGQTGSTGSSSNKVAKGTVFESKKAEYKVTDAKNKSVVYMNSNAKKASSVKVPDTIEYKNKTYKVTQIAPNAFKGNKKLTKLVIGKNVKKIGNNAFRGCKKLKSVTFGKNVVSIGAYAFYGDKKLTTINFGTKKLNKVGKAAFKNISKHPTAKVPKEKIGKYQKLIKKAL